MWLKLEGAGSLQQQLQRALRAAILEGVLRPGERLPGSRTLARELGLSRNTVLIALQQLLSEGYLGARAGSGSYVAQELPLAPSSPARAASAAEQSPRPRLARAARALQQLPLTPSWELRRDPGTVDFRYGDAAYQDLPIVAWGRLYGRVLRRAGVRDLSYRVPGGLPVLREALCAYLARARGVRCTPQQVIVTAGSQQAIDLALRVLVDPGDRVALEEPHYPGFRLPLMQARAKLLPVPVDEHGMCVERLARSRNVRLVCVTPSHQFPTGALLSAARRLALLSFAHAQGAYVIEDDYDGEFRYAGAAVESLQGRDPQRVLYMGTFSKVMFPALRLGYVVVPEALVDPFLRMKVGMDTGSAGLDQLALAEFIARGQLERHIRRTRLRNAKRRAALLAALERRLAGRVRVAGPPAGLHVWLELPELLPEHARSLQTLARTEGVTLHSAAACYLRRPPHASFILGYASLTPSQIERGVAALGRALARVGTAAAGVG